MGEVALKVTGLLPQISSLFDNDLYSDVQFLFITDRGKTKKMYGHKLILALRSKVFASMFYDSTKSSSEITVDGSKESFFTQLIRFLYTDHVQIQTFEEGKELFQLANEYAVEELAEKCANYIRHEALNVENVIPIYECAIVQNMQLLLSDCQDFVCLNAEVVLESVHFTNASLKVVEDIVRLDNLSVPSELTIIGAVLKWGSEELKRKEMSQDEKYLRKCIEPLMKHLRFLALSFSEFDYFIENFNIFTGYESSILTRKIYQSHSFVDFPENLCPILIKRGKKLSSSSTQIEQKNTLLRSPTSAPTSFDAGRASALGGSSSHISFFKVSRSVSHTNTKTFDESPISHGNKISYEVKKHSSSNAANVSQSKLKGQKPAKVSLQNNQQKFFSSPNLSDEKHFSTSLSNYSRLIPPTPLDEKYSLPSCHREFEFRLQESQPCLGASFPKDVKSSLSFNMLSGNMSLYGFEIKVKNNNSKPLEIEIDIDLKGFSKKIFSHQFVKELKDNCLTLMFPEKMTLQENFRGVLDVSIDNLSLDRCCICDISKKINLNRGLGFACEISLGSTQKLPETANDYVFLISKLIYMPC